MDDGEERAKQARRAQRGRNIAIGVGLGLLVLLFFIMTIVRLSTMANVGTAG